MARNLIDDTYYKSGGGKIPVKWTSPEVTTVWQTARFKENEQGMREKRLEKGGSASIESLEGQGSSRS